MRNLTFKQLHAVRAISRRGTITAAAQELNVTPAALTSRLKQLEEEAGMPLFDRTTEGMRLTEAGREVLAATDSIDVILENCVARLEALKGLTGGRVGIAVVSTAKYFAPKAIAAFTRHYPGVEISLFVGNRDSTIGLLRDYGADLAIMGRPPVDFPVESQNFGDHPHILIAPPDHPLAGRRRIPKSDLAGESFLVREEGSGTRGVFEEFIGGVVVKRPRLGIEVGSNETIKQAVMAGLGIALLSAHTVAAEVMSRRLAVLDVEGLPIRRRWYVVRRTEKAHGPAPQAFWSFVLREGPMWLPHDYWMRF